MNPKILSYEQIARQVAEELLNMIEGEETQEGKIDFLKGVLLRCADPFSMQLMYASVVIMKMAEEAEKE